MNDKDHRDDDDDQNDEDHQGDVVVSGGEDNELNDTNRSDEEIPCISRRYRHEHNNNHHHLSIPNKSMFSKNFYKLLSQNNLQHHLPYSTHSPNGSACSSASPHSAHSKHSELSRSGGGHSGKKAAVQVLVKENEQNEVAVDTDVHGSNLNNSHAQMLLSSLNAAAAAAAVAANNGGNASHIDTFNALNALNMAQMLAAQAQHPGTSPAQQSQALAALTSFYNNCSSKQHPGLDLMYSIASNTSSSPGSPPPPQQTVLPAPPPPLPNNGSMIYQRNYLEALRFYKLAYANQRSNTANTAN